MSDKPITVLLIEDNAGDARLIREILSEVKSPPFELDYVERLSAGLERLAAGGIDVVLLDLSLSDSQGAETFVKLRGQDSRAPILVLTGLDDEDMALRAMQAGAQDYLVKGQFTGGMLARAIRYAIERKRSEQGQRFLAQASTLLATSLDYTTTLDHVAQLAVPSLADWCAVHMLEADGTIQRLAVAHMDPARATLARERTDRYPLDPNARHIVPQVIRTGRSELYTEVPDSLLIASARDADHLETLRMLGFKSYICVPLMVHGRTFGAITLAISESGRRYDEHDLMLAEELARRAADAINNARLYHIAQEEIAERKRMEATLRESEERLAGIVGSAMDAIISVDESQHILVFNTTAEHMFRCPAAAAIGQSIERFIPAHIRPIHAGHIGAFGQTGVTGRSMRSLGTLTALRVDGKEFPIEAAISQTVAAGQKLYTVIIRDITARQQAEEQLQYQAALLQSVSDAIVASDLDFRITSWNQAAEAIYGWSAAEVIGQLTAAVLETGYTDHLPEQVLRQFQEQGIWQGEAIQRRKDGTQLTILASVSLVRDSAGQPVGVVAVNRDITDRKRAEAALRQSEERFAKAFRASPAAMAISRLNDSCFIDVNASYQRLFGYHRDELIGQSGVELGIYTSPEQRATLMRMLHEQGAVREFELTLRAKSGELRNVLFSSETIELDGEACILAIIIDITDRKRLEAQFHQAQKMESVGRLAGSVAHDFNNLLTAISGYAELALRTLPPTAVASEDLREIVKVAGRAAALTRQLLTFARKQIIEPQVLKLNDLIGELDKLLQRLIGEDIELVTLLSTDPGQVKIDPGQIEQVLVNLAVNARDAMPKGGKLTIETHNVVLDHNYAQQHLDVIPGPYVLVAVSDTGIGMDAETQGRIFEPFFTTKEPERGTGLGLATCYGIIKQHGGHIWVYSELQQGTTFKIYLPQTDASAAARIQCDDIRELPRGVETVLLAEDEPAVRALAARTLREQGYTVLEAVDGAMALHLASEYIGATIDLLLTDAVMPQIGGKALFDQLNVFYPNIKALFISGYTDDAIVHHGRLEPDAAFLQKPFSPSALVLKVREVLDVLG